MRFEQIIVFSLKDFNNNKENDGYSPQDGQVINVFYNVNRLHDQVAVGFEKK